MTRQVLALLASVAAFPALAEDFRVLAPVTDAVIYPQGATLTRSISRDLPAGKHRILLPVVGGMFDYALPRLSGEGAAKVGAVEFLPAFVTDAEQVYNPAQSAALAQVKNLEDEVMAQEDLVAQSTSAVRAAEARIAFLQSIGAGAVETLDPTALKATADMVQTEVAGAFDAKAAAKIAGRTARDALEELNEQLMQAKADFARLTPPSGAVDMLAFTVDLDAADTVDLDLKYLTGAASWRVDYEMFLTTGDAARITADRKVIVQQQTGELWSDVALTLSTADPFAQIAPREVYPNQAFIQDPQLYKSIARASGAPRLEAEAMSDVMIEEPVIVEEVTAGLQVDGLSITYGYPQAVSVSPGNAPLVLALDTIEFEAEVFNRAAPRFDETAFLMARFTNTQPDALLPGEANLFRDGVFVGRSQLEQIPASTEAEVSFGALEGLRLDFRLLKNDTGDRGLLSSSSTRKQSMEFSVENLTTEATSIETIFALPYTEQEDLVLRVASRPSPDENEFDKRRGVSVWDLQLKPGEKKTVRVDVDLSWPEGQTMIWQP